MKKYYLPILFFVMALSVLAPISAYAINYPSIPAPVPGGYVDLDCIVLPDGSLRSASDCSASYRPPATVGTLVLVIFSLAIWLGAFLALVSLIYTGGQFVFSGQNPGIRVAARERLQNVIMGILILLFTTVILNAINPDITRLDLANTNVSTGNVTDVGLPDEDTLKDVPGTYSCDDTGSGCALTDNSCTKGYILPQDACNSANACDSYSYCYNLCIDAGFAPGFCRNSCTDSNIPVKADCEISTFTCGGSGCKEVTSGNCPEGYKTEPDFCFDIPSDVCSSKSAEDRTFACTRIPPCNGIDNEKECVEKFGCEWGGGFLFFGNECRK